MERNNNGIVKLIVKLAIALAAVAAVLTATLIIIKKWEQIKAALNNVKNAVTYTCDDLSCPEDEEDIFCEGDEEPENA